MIICPVCEHPQAFGSECDVCGKILAGGEPRDASPEPLPGLEPTHHGDVIAPAAPLPELEPTSHAAADGFAAPALEGLEPTWAAGLPDDGPTPAPIAVLCRYCRAPAMPGERLCGSCGMRLPVVEPARGPAEGAPAVRCACGTPVPGALCPSCGARRVER